jgi:signal transduction histidine kinase
MVLPRVLGQQNLVSIDVSKIKLAENIGNKTWFWGDSLRNLQASQVFDVKFEKQAPKNIFRAVIPRLVEKDWWLNFQLQNSADTAITVYFIPGVYFSRIDIYQANDSLKKMEAVPAKYAPNIEDSIGYRTLKLAPHSSYHFYTALRLIKTDVNALGVFIVRDYYLTAFETRFRTATSNNRMYYYIITGILLMMIFYSMAVFILNGSIEFLYYACFAFFMGLMFFLKSYFFKATTPFNYFFESYLDFIIMCLGFFFYFIFLRRFLETRKYFPFLHKLFITGQVIIALSILLFSIYNFYSPDFLPQNRIESITKLQWFVITAIFIVYAIVHNNRMLNYLAFGHFFLLATSIFSLLLINSPNKLNLPNPSIWGDALFCFEFGITIELIFFLMGLAFKNRRDLIERTRERERLKLDNERKEFEKQLAIVAARQEERDRISTDMHDELGSGVTAIRLMSEIVKTKMKGNTLPEIEKISNNANDLLGKMNTIIWTMSSSNDRLDNMIAYIRSHALEFLESTNIDCHFSTPDYIPPVEISGEKRRNIFLCVKESLNNIAKHSGAQDVWIDFKLQSDNMEIEIHDNGVGINLEKLREFGNGLTNMRKRMQNIEGKFTIMNKDGTTTKFVIPL